MKKTTNKIKKGWEYPTCNLCGSDDYTVVWKDMTYWEYAGVFQVVQCNTCKLVYTCPRPTLSEIEKFYIQENYWGRDFRKGKETYDDSKERDHAYGHTYKILASLKKKGKILDIGAGTGLFLSRMKNEGWDVFGVELSKDAVIYAKKRYGITLQKGDFFDVKYPKNSFDIVVLNGALEHMYKPYETLKEIYSLLKKGGVVFFTVPNVESIGNKLFGKDWFPWQLPRHLYHFSGTTASKMVKKAGFNEPIVRYDYWLQNNYILFQSLRYSKSPKFQKNPKGGLKQPEKIHVSEFSVKKAIGKVIGGIFAYILAFIEPYIHKGEVLVVYVKK